MYYIYSLRPVLAGLEIYYKTYTYYRLTANGVGIRSYMTVSHLV